MKSRTLRVIAIFMAINILIVTFTPTVSYALTSGPTAPEYTGFEPVDTTDMVNMATGDFTYNIPLLEVPGPEGGYPLALSYHAGISPEEEASWVGLGWSLNAGAINRIVNVHPDDMKNSNVSIVDAWSGGETKEYSLGVGIGPVSAGFTYAIDTYQGTGIGTNFGLGIPFKAGGNSGIGLNAGTGAFGGGYVGVGLFAGTAGDGAKASASVGAAVVFDANGAASLSAYAGGGISYKKGAWSHSLMGANISTADKSPKMDVAGISATFESASGNISTHSVGIGVSIPIYCVTLDLGFNSTRYYMNEYKNVKPLGTLYPSTIPSSSNISFDSYSLKDPSADVYSDPDKHLAGSFPAFDAYNVSAQGIGGSIQPYYHELGTIMSSSDMDYVGYQVVFDPDFDVYEGSNNRKVGFRFVNDFSNSLDIGNVGTGQNANEYRDNITAEIGKGKKNFGQTATDFNPANGILAGSRHIEWFTNQEINQAIQSNNYSNLHGFIPSSSTRPTYFTTDNYGVSVYDGIGGFMITNSSGVTYHYALPVYNFEVYQYFKSADEASTRETNKSHPYAYTWLLTAITGPDYVDRAENGGAIGEVDQSDFGYWVKFMYGKWTDRYAWRTPNEGFDKDIDNSSNSYSYGKKELYYLDAVVTRSHTALFAKSIRRDAKGITVDTEYKGRSEGRFGIRKNVNDAVIGASASTLKLDKILLFTNRYLEKKFETEYPSELISSITELKQLYGSSNNPQVPSGTGSGTESVHRWDNVLDVNDFGASFSDAAERQIVFNHSYDLCKFNPTSSDNSNNLNKSYNSFDLDYANATITNYGNSGKLTLNSIEIRGRNAKKIIPNTTFSYNLNPNYNKEAVDLWGNYQSDWNPNSYPIYKYTSSASGQNVHAWSLTGINTALGATVKVNYESDTYITSVVNDWKYYQMYLIEKGTQVNDIRLYVAEKDGFTLKNFIKAGNRFDAQFAIEKEETAVQKIRDPEEPNQFTTRTDKKYTYSYYNKQYVIKAIEGANKIVVTDPALFALLSDNVCNDCPLSGNVCCDLNTDNCPNLVCPCENCSVSYNVILGNAFAHRTNGSVATEDIGGGIRTESIELISDNMASITNYDYVGGVTSTEPYEYNFKYVNTPKGDAGNQVPGFYDSYKKTILEKYTPLNAVNRFLPPPGVVYSKVIVSEKVKNFPGTSAEVVIAGNGSTEYEFETYSSALLPKTTVALTTGKYVKMSDYRNRVGLLKKITAKNPQGVPLTVTENIYLHNESTDFKYDLKNTFNNQGKLDQVYFVSKTVREKDFLGEIITEDTKLMVTEVEEYPVIQVATIVSDLKKNISQQTRTLAFDYYSGNPIGVLTSDSYGNSFLTETVPAYTLAQYSGMGLKLFNPLNRHMTLQEAGQYVYKVGTDIGYLTNFKSSHANPASITGLGQLGLISANVQTWANNIPVLNSIGIADPSWVAAQSLIWRKKSTYNWSGDDGIALNADGSYSLTDFTTYPFNYTNPVLSNSRWQFMDEIISTDVYSHVLQTSDMYGRSSAALYDPTQKFLIAIAQNAGLSTVAYSGAEYSEYYNSYNPSGVYKEGNVTVTNNFNNITIDEERSHTGKYCLRLNVGENGFNYSFSPVAGKKYRASAWVYLPGTAENNLNAVNISYEVNGTFVTKAVPVAERKARSFYLINLDIDATSLTGTDQISVYCENENASRAVYFDDFRVHPLDADFGSFVYDLDRNLLVAILNKDNFYTRFVYDEAGKLSKTYQELLRPNEKLVREQRYNYGSTN